MKLFDKQFITLSNVALAQAHINHNVQLFATICNNVRNDLQTLDINIKELQRCLEDGKRLYVQCTMPYNYVKDMNDEISSKRSELQKLTSTQQQVGTLIEDIEVVVSKFHDD